ncbi:nucleoside-diphosphate-sugar epimerase [Microbacterium phyllosphaerae]|uniref:Nucleoside-diphosphate-sugar epimerase n=1 Tax=Microbacterium phyllosphaerae TaxID=124798 RepID=A0ABS4WJY2_9MICO|nr:sugar nucleotide-binding protein [Microbacterium phyllosphaerae]MBP2376513.1 nucleoside-diphosphate-sugar epimerase [Microbacterium phyllosphaerae]
MTDPWGLETRAPGSVLLVGCGKLGARLGERLIAQGAEVTAMRRHASDLPFPTIEADLRHPLDRELPAYDSVVITLPPSTEGDSIYPPALRGLADALPAMPSRVVFVSSTRVFEGRPGETPLTERDAPRVSSERGGDLLEGEQLAMELFGARIVRPAGIYGPGRDFLIRRVTEGAAVDHSRRTNRIHETDLVRLLEAMLRADSAPPLIHAVDTEPVLLGDVVSHLARRLGVEPPPHLDPEVGGGTVLDGHLLREFLGALEYPTFREGYDEMIAAR